MSVVKYLGVGRCKGRVGEGEVLVEWNNAHEKTLHLQMYAQWLQDLIGNGDVLAAFNRKPLARFHKLVSIDDNRPDDNRPDDNRPDNNKSHSNLERELHWIGKGTDMKGDSHTELMFYAVLPVNFTNMAAVSVDQFLQYFRSTVFNAFNDGKDTICSSKAKDIRSQLDNILVKVVEYAGRSKVQLVREQVGTVTEQMHQNVQLVIDRQEKLEVLQEKSAELETYSRTFQQKAHAVERQECWKSYKITIIIILIIAAILLVVITPLAVSLSKN